MLWKLSLGQHTVEVTVTDNAGLVTKQEATFTVDTSFADVRALVQALTSNSLDRSKLLHELDQAQTAMMRGQYSRAARELGAFKADVRRSAFTDVAARTVLLRDADVLIDRLP